MGKRINAIASHLARWEAIRNRTHAPKAAAASTTVIVNLLFSFLVLIFSPNLHFDSVLVSAERK